MSARRNIRYSPLTGEETDDDNGIGGREDPRFSYNPRAFDRIPWKSIALALFLLALGSVLLSLSFFMFAGHMEGDNSQAFGLLALGILSFLPGFYETRVAYYAWRGAPGTWMGPWCSYLITAVHFDVI
ncbi:transmembrane protein 230 isoform X1 [Phalaenopsis equestris]|uniref:transmembrane protein 230 isoform X1 n=1 Tax=Phalaenopsis equestris TaxID=78828 RepID=UPI0009E638F1|nr:transmembrane protein 230 isoform X1 [Phalaenopsis equestris]